MRWDVFWPAFWNFVLSAVIAGSGVMLTSIAQTNAVTPVAIWIGVLTGLAAGGNAAKAYVAEPPRNPTARTRRSDRRIAPPSEA